VAGSEVRKAEADAEGRRIGAELGLGECLGTWDGSKLTGRVVFGLVLITLAVVALIGALTPLGGPGAKGGLGGILVFLAVGVPLVAFPRRTRVLLVHRYEAGLAKVTGRERSVWVMRWDDLASMSLSVVAGYDEDYVDRCELRDHAGGVIAVDKKAGAGLVARKAEQALAGHLAGPLTARLDAGLPVTVGCLTVGPSGIRCRGHWNVSWKQVSGIETRLHGHRVTVSTGGRIDKHAALAGQPNEFLARYVLQHAARQAGVPFTSE
jgi:hypothetical protein